MYLSIYRPAYLSTYPLVVIVMVVVVVVVVVIVVVVIVVIVRVTRARQLSNRCCQLRNTTPPHGKRKPVLKIIRALCAIGNVISMTKHIATDDTATPTTKDQNTVQARWRTVAPAVLDIIISYSIIQYNIL